MTKPAPDHSPLLKSIMARSVIPVVTEDDADAFLAAHGHCALFFSGDWERLAESNDVAVVLPELRRMVGDLAIAVVARGAAERALQLRYHFNKFPALVFTRGTGYLGAIMGMRDWAEYGQEVAAILASDVREPPPFRLPDGCVANGAPNPDRLQTEMLIH
jgi:hydrogenase-1 operon protein HyaE